MTKNIEIGKFGEEIASKYLKRNGYEILMRNYRKKFGEIDIITKNSGELIFFEIKTLLITNKDQIKPEDNFTTQKEIKVKRICQFFVAENPHLLDEKFGWRIDVMSIEISLDKKITLRHYKNI